MIHMKAGIAIVHEHRRSCQVDHDQVSAPSGVIAAGYGVPSGWIVSYITHLDCRTDAARSADRPAWGVSETGSTAALIHNVQDVIDNSVGGFLEGAVPCGGTRSEVSARRAGALGAIGVRRTLSTGQPVQAAEMITSRAAVTSPRFAPEGGVRFGWYTTAMTACTALSAPAPLYVRASSVTLVGGAR